MKWSEKYATGIDALDDQHKMLFRISDEYRAALDAGQGQRVYGLFLGNLEDYARAHFGIEEQCMYRLECPAAQTNSEAHGQFEHAVAHFKHLFREHGFSREEAQQVVDFVDRWLDDHIGRIDVQLRSCVGAE